jgi:anti-sigma regulatory factor (Ser/Thr protein kinase)
MSDSSRFTCELRAVLPATLEAVEEFFIEFRRRARGLLDRVDCFAAELLVREALTNAVVHGCHADAARQIRCSLRLRSRRLLIVVADDGDGFDWRTAWRKTAVFPDCSGRGIEILRKYASRVRFSERGNVVTMLKRM